MKEISCEICMDLMPLVRDGAASGDSIRAVERHVETCEACRALFEEGRIPDGSEEKALSRAVRRVQTLSTVVVAVFLLLGICLCELVMQGSSLFFLAAAAVIIWLLRFAFRKGGDWKQKLQRIGAFLTAAALIAGLGWGFNELFGNPISKQRAKEAVQAYLEETYGALDPYISEISYTTSSTSYDAEVRLPDSDACFRVVYRDGKVLYDTYEEDVLNQENEEQ